MSNFKSSSCPWNLMIRDETVFSAFKDRAEKDGLALREGRNQEVCFTPIIDSGTKECIWHCIKLDADIPHGSSIRVSIEVSEDGIQWKGGSGRTITSQDLMYIPVRAESGKFIRIGLVFNRSEEGTPFLRNVFIYYPRPSDLRPNLLSYLPALYQEMSGSGDFMERFLSIFASEIYDTEDMISRIPQYFDPALTPEDFVPWLAGWLSLDLYQLLGELNREYILRAVEFYRQKGTASGLASLVSFLTGNKCCVKEYMNNVFRSYGREHAGWEDSVDNGCIRSFHKTSLSLNTADSQMLSRMGTYYDEVHYTVDTGPNGLISPCVVGLFIFLTGTLAINKDELMKIIDSFLPVFVRAEIFTVEVCDEVLIRDDIQDRYKEIIRSVHEDHIGIVNGSYRDEVSWNWLLSYKKASDSNLLSEKGRTNKLSYRTPQSNLGKDIAL